jgi:phage terminase large subunit
MTIYEFCDKHKIKLMIGYNPEDKNRWSVIIVKIHHEFFKGSRRSDVRGTGKTMEGAIKNMVKLLSDPNSALWILGKKIDTSELEM